MLRTYIDPSMVKDVLLNLHVRFKVHILLTIYIFNLLQETIYRHFYLIYIPKFNSTFLPLRIKLVIYMSYIYIYSFAACNSLVGFLALHSLKEIFVGKKNKAGAL